MNFTILIDLLKLVFLVIVVFMTAWLRDYYLKRRRVESYREHLFKERLKIYHELWEHYVKLTRILGTKGASVTAIGLNQIPSKRKSYKASSIESSDISNEEHKENSEELINELISEIENFIMFARGTYIFLDSQTIKAIEAAIKTIEGKTTGGRLMIDWGALHECSLELQQAIRIELGFEKLLDLNAILKLNQ